MADIDPAKIAAAVKNERDRIVVALRRLTDRIEPAPVEQAFLIAPIVRAGRGGNPVAVKASCNFCDWGARFPVAFLSATEVAVLYEHARDCKAVGGRPVNPQAAGSVLERFTITQQ